MGLGYNVCVIGFTLLDVLRNGGNTGGWGLDVEGSQ